MMRAAHAAVLLVILSVMPMVSAFLPSSPQHMLRSSKQLGSPCVGRHIITRSSSGTRQRVTCQFELPKFNMPNFEMPKFGGFGAQPVNVEEKVDPAPPPPSRLQVLKEKLIETCDDAQKGVQGTGSMTKEDFNDLVDQICSLNPTEGPAVSPLMDGRWELAWTTEKEVLFLIEKGLFWDKFTDVYQTIDTAAPSLSNTVEFENDGFLKVLSSFRAGEVNGDASRFDFKFSSAALKWRQFQLTLPPVGEGWSNQVFLDKTLRIQKDSRGDLAIYCKR